MKTRNIIITVVVIIIVVIIIMLIGASSNPAPVPVDTSRPTPTPSVQAYDQTTSDGTITFGYPSAGFGLATNKTQILVKSYIPPCDDNFNYCLYYVGTAYKGTNFESAGLRIKKRTDLSNERICLNTPPSGYSASTTPDATNSTDEDSVSEFNNVGDAAAGHFALGNLYRLFVRASSTCYEFETRIGQTQFQNYPTGSINEFTPADQQAVKSSLHDLVENISLPSGRMNLFP